MNVGSELEQHRGKLFAMLYRMTGVAADADDLVQETFARALSHPPPDTARSIEPWLVRIAMNAGRDQLRRRKTAGYRGPWLPSPIETDELASDLPIGSARYGELESVSFAFLSALEVLSPTQRAVLVLRDVFDCSVRETAELLELSEPNVKVSHHRAREKLADYDAAREQRLRPNDPRVREALVRFLVIWATGDVEAIAKLLAEDVVALNDGAGEFTCAQRPVRGRERVARFLMKASTFSRLVRIAPVAINGTTAVAIEVDRCQIEGTAHRQVHLLQVDANGKIRVAYAVLATRKLMRLAVFQAGPGKRT